MQRAYLHSSVTNESITRMVEHGITELANSGSITLGQDVMTKSPNAWVLVGTKVWGFNRDRSKVILEVKINNVSVNRVIVDKCGESYRVNTYPRFISDYKRKVGVQS